MDHSCGSIGDVWRPFPAQASLLGRSRLASRSLSHGRLPAARRPSYLDDEVRPERKAGDV